MSLVLTSRRGGRFRYKGRVSPLESVRRELTGHFEKLLLTDDSILNTYHSNTVVVFTPLQLRDYITQVIHTYTIIQYLLYFIYQYDIIFTYRFRFSLIRLPIF